MECSKEQAAGGALHPKCCRPALVPSKCLNHSHVSKHYKVTANPRPWHPQSQKPHWDGNDAFQVGRVNSLVPGQHTSKAHPSTVRITMKKYEKYQSVARWEDHELWAVADLAFFEVPDRQGSQRPPACCPCKEEQERAPKRAASLKL